MPAALPTAPPAAIRAGDSVTWQRSLRDYPASDGWALKYTLVAASGAYNFEATADGDDFLVELASDVTEAWEPGRYSLTEYVEKAPARTTLQVTPLQVQPDLAGATGGIDTRSHARKMLDSIDAWLETSAPTVAKMEINGRRIENYGLDELLAMRSRYAAEVAREDAAASGGRTGRLLVRV